MIVVKQKPLEDIIKALGDSKKILIVGCDGCAAIHQAGGIKQAEVLRGLIKMAKKIKENVEVEVETGTVLRQCDREVVIKSLSSAVEGYDAVLSMACGAGVQTLAEVFPDRYVVPANDTMFIGVQDFAQRKLSELCQACGDCILHETGGICPITRCAKSLLNGPCGGQAGGKCEVGGWKKDCAWVLVYNRLKETGRLDLFLRFRPPRNHRVSQSPREVTLPEAAKTKEAGGETR